MTIWVDGHLSPRIARWISANYLTCGNTSDAALQQMKDHIVQEVREARAAVAADFGFDLHKFFAWAKAHTAAERNAKQWLPTGPKKTRTTTGAVPLSRVAQKRRARPSGASA